MPAPVNSQRLIDSIRSTYGNNVTTADLKGYAAANSIGYLTVTKYLKPYRVGARGRWDLTVKEARKQFEKYDADGSGSITVDEMKLVFEERAGRKLEPKEVKQMLKDVDENDDGQTP